MLPNGRVGDARIVRSSGFERSTVTLDEARRNWRLLPATRDGEPFAQWHRLRVVFKLKNQVSDAIAAPARRPAPLRARQAADPRVRAPGVAGTVTAGPDGIRPGGRLCRHSRSTKNRLTAATGTNIHGHGDPFFSGSLIVLPTSNRLERTFTAAAPQDEHMRLAFRILGSRRPPAARARRRLPLVRRLSCLADLELRARRGARPPAKWLVTTRSAMATRCATGRACVSGPRPARS